MLEIGKYTLKEPQYIEWDVFGNYGSGIAVGYEVEQEQNGYILQDGGYMCTDYITNCIPLSEYNKIHSECPNMPLRGNSIPLSECNKIHSNELYKYIITKI